MTLSESKRTMDAYLHGVGLAVIEAMWEAQGRMCALCHREPPMGRHRRPYVVDHDHRCCPGPVSCGSCIRGLICPQCNAGLGQFGDDPARLMAAAMYVERRPMSPMSSRARAPLPSRAPEIVLAERGHR